MTDWEANAIARRAVGVKADNALNPLARSKSRPVHDLPLWRGGFSIPDIECPSAGPQSPGDGREFCGNILGGRGVRSTPLSNAPPSPVGIAAAPPPCFGCMATPSGD